MSKMASELRHAIGSISTKSFLNPLLWLCGIITVPSFVLCFISEEPWMQVSFFIAGMLPLFTTLFLTFRHKDRPELFQSEEFRLRDRALRIYGDSAGGPIPDLSQIVGAETAMKLLDANSSEAKS